MNCFFLFQNRVSYKPGASFGLLYLSTHARAKS